MRKWIYMYIYLRKCMHAYKECITKCMSAHVYSWTSMMVELEMEKKTLCVGSRLIHQYISILTAFNDRDTCPSTTLRSLPQRVRRAKMARQVAVILSDVRKRVRQFAVAQTIRSCCSLRTASATLQRRA